MARRKRLRLVGHLPSTPSRRQRERASDSPTRCDEEHHQLPTLLESPSPDNREGVSDRRAARRATGGERHSSRERAATFCYREGSTGFLMVLAGTRGYSQSIAGNTREYTPSSAQLAPSTPPVRAEFGPSPRGTRGLPPELAASSNGVCRELALSSRRARGELIHVQISTQPWIRLVNHSKIDHRAPLPRDTGMPR